MSQFDVSIPVQHRIGALPQEAENASDAWYRRRQTENLVAGFDIPTKALAKRTSNLEKNMPKKTEAREENDSCCSAESTFNNCRRRQCLLIIFATAILSLAIICTGIAFARLHEHGVSRAHTTHMKSSRTISWIDLKHKKSHPFSFKKHSKDAPLCDMKQDQDIDFTLAIQLSYSRIWIMQHQCKRWGNNHMSLAVAFRKEIEKKLTTRRLREMGCNMDKMKVSFLHHDPSNYPVNRLRNLALSKVNTSHSITMDSDFLVSSNLHDALLVHRAVLASDDKTALVIPAFEVRKHNTCKSKKQIYSKRCKMLHVSMVPDTKAKLLQKYYPVGNVTQRRKKQTVQVFKARRWFWGHSTTCSSSWRDQSDSELYPIKCLMSSYYEPYVAVRHCRETPPYQESFTGFGENKLTWIQQLMRSGVTLFRIGDGFCVHVPHKKSRASKNEKLSRKNLKVVKKSFERWMNASVPDRTRTGMCRKNGRRNRSSPPLSEPFAVIGCDEGGGAQRSNDMKTFGKTETGTIYPKIA